MKSFDRRKGSLPAFACGIASAICAAARPSSCLAAVIHVPGDQPTIQAAVDAAANGDTVLIAPGTYNEAVNLGGKAVSLQSVAGPAATVIDATGTNKPGLKIPPTGAGSVSITGLTIQHGKAETVVSPPFNTTGGGGGVRINDAEVLLTDCVIKDNLASATFVGGGGLGAGGATLTMRGCVVSGNTSSSSASMSSAFGGGGGLVNGGAMRFSGGNAVLVNCVLDGNTANAIGSLSGGSGGTISAVSSAVITLENCRLTRNQSSPSVKSPGIAASSVALNVHGCTIASNAIMGTPLSNTVGGITFSGSCAVTNSIVHGNAGTQINGPAAASFSCIEGGFAGTGNISSDPQFLNTGVGDFHLQSLSPCIDAGDISLVRADAHDLDGDGNTTERIPFDLDGLRRVVNGFVDIGAHEAQRTCPADVSPSSPGVFGDGTVNASDLLVVTNAWGDCDGCVADVNGDGHADIDDLFLVVNAWGPCRP